MGEVIKPSKQIVSPSGQAMSSRPAMSDQQAIDMHLGGYFNFLRMIGVPTPTKAEARNLLYSELYVKYMQEVQKQQRQEFEKLQQNLPIAKQALQMMDDVQKYNVNIGQVIADAKQKKEEEEKSQTQEASGQEPDNGTK